MLTQLRSASWSSPPTLLVGVSRHFGPGRFGLRCGRFGLGFRTAKQRCTAPRAQRCCPSPAAGGSNSPEVDCRRDAGGGRLGGEQAQLLPSAVSVLGGIWRCERAVTETTSSSQFICMWMWHVLASGRRDIRFSQGLACSKRCTRENTLSCGTPVDPLVQAI
jgi:hypothetical protein